MFKLKTIAALVALLVFPALLMAGSTQTSSISGQEVIDRARVILQETTADHWSDTDLIEYVNEGMVDLATQALCTQTTEDVSLVAGQEEYTLSTTYISIEHAVYVDQDGKWTGLEKAHPADMNKTGESWNDTKVPAFWYEWNSKLGVFPPMTSVSGETVKVYLISRPSTIAVSGTVTTPAIYDRALVRYVAAQALLDKRRFADYDTLMKEYQSEIDRYRQDFNELDKK